MVIGNAITTWLLQENKGQHHKNIKKYEYRNTN